MTQAASHWRRKAAWLWLGILASVAFLSPPVAAGNWYEGFDGPLLEPVWTWIREDPTHWSLTDRPGSLRIFLQKGGLYADTNNSQNLLLQPAPDGDYSVEIYLEFAPQQNFQKAGIVFYQDDDNLLFVGRAFCDEETEGCIGDAVYFDVEEYGEPNTSVPPVRPDSPQGAYIRLEKSGRQFTAKYSPDGDRWTIVGSVVSPIVPKAVGLVADDSNQGAREIAADFGFFNLSGDNVVSNMTVNPLARAIDKEELGNAVTTWVRTVTADARPDAVIQRIEPYEESGEIYAYIVHLEGGGYCLTGADALVLPVYLYSTADTYDQANPNASFVLREIAQRTIYLRALDNADPQFLELQRELEERAALWTELVGAAASKEFPLLASTMNTNPTSLALPLTCRWGQGVPYNEFCPDLPTGSGNHTLVGCVATAMSQVMYYWSWPKTGAGSNTVIYSWRDRATWDQQSLSVDPCIPAGGWNGRLRWAGPAGPNANLEMNGSWDDSILAEAVEIACGIAPVSGYLGSLGALWGRMTTHSDAYTASFGVATYDWSLARDLHTLPLDAGDLEAAEISFHAGLAVSMHYGLWSSGAWPYGDPVVADALEDHFQYDPDTSRSYRGSDSAALIVDEVKWLRPVIIGGAQHNGGGHAWVICGYNTNTDPWQFMMNMGWPGRLDNVDWYTLDNVPLGLNFYQELVTHIAPLSAVRFVGSGSSGDGSPDDPYRDIQEALADSLPEGATLIFQAGSKNTFTGASLLIDKPLTLKGVNVTIESQ